MKKQDAADTDFAGTPPESRSPIVEDAAATDARATGPSATALPDADTVETGGVSHEPRAVSNADRDAAKQKAEGVKPPEAPDYAPVQPESEIQARSGQRPQPDASSAKPRKPDQSG